MRHLGARIVIAGLVASACSGAAVGTSGTSVASPSDPPASSESAPSTGTAGPSLDASGPRPAFRAAPDTPVVTRAMTGLDEQYINPGAVIDVDGELHMIANVFTAWPGPVAMPHLVSDDGVAWNLDRTGTLLTSAEIPLANPGADVSTGFIAADGTWTLIFETVASGRPWVLGRATAPRPQGPWTIDEQPILEPGPAGAWDAGGLSWPSVVPNDAGGYVMWFQASERVRGPGVIGRATSVDGVTWRKDDAPVLVPGVEWERGSLDRPRVVRTSAGLFMLYAGGRLAERGGAWSDDGITWRRTGATPLITADDFPVPGQAWDAALILRDSTLGYFLEIGTTGSAGTQVYRFTAELP